MQQILQFQIILTIVHSTLYNFNKKQDSDYISPWIGSNFKCSTGFNKISIHNKIAYSGYVQPNKNKNNCFGYILWLADYQDITEQPLIIWLQGGPGSSSQFANFQENGPFLVNGTQDNFKISINNQSWNKNASVLYIDNPIGTGLSYAQNISDVPKDQDEVAQQFYDGLIELYLSLFKKLNMKDTKLYLFGEQYAGKYIPAISEQILEKNQISKFKIPLFGIGIGSGFTYPLAIQSKIGNFAYNLGLIDFTEKPIFDQNAQKIYDYTNHGKLEEARNLFFENLQYIGNRSGIHDIYNFQNQQTPIDLDLDAFLNSQTFKDLFQFESETKFEANNQQIFDHFKNDFMRNDCIQKLENILQKGLQVLYYVGQNDISVCSPCIQSWLDKIEYSGNTNQEFSRAKFLWWNATDNTNSSVIGGYYKQVYNLKFMTVNKAGGHAALDQPYFMQQLVFDWIFQ